MDSERLDQKIGIRTIQQRSNDAGGSHIVDNRQSGSRNYLSGAPLQRLEEEEEENPLQGKMEDAPRRNETGLPDNLKAGVESLSGYSLDDVRVHYNSSKPAAVQALAYTQGTDIHVAPGQEKHLPHEAWHVAQQMAGRVSPTTNINGMPVNDNVALEHEADVMGEKAVTQRKVIKCSRQKAGTLSSNSIIQCLKDFSIDAADVGKAIIPAKGHKDASDLVDSDGIDVGKEGMKHFTNSKSKGYSTKFYDPILEEMYAVGNHDGGGYEIIGVDTARANNPFMNSKYARMGKMFHVFIRGVDLGVKGSAKAKVKKRRG